MEHSQTYVFHPRIIQYLPVLAVNYGQVDLISKHFVWKQNRPLMSLGDSFRHCCA